MRKWIPLLTVALGTFMLLVDVTIVNVALPKMAVDLGTSFSSLQWVIDIYALALAPCCSAPGRSPISPAGASSTSAASCCSRSPRSPPASRPARRR
jgi:MFS family permease